LSTDLNRRYTVDIFPDLTIGSVVAIALTLGIVQAVKEALNWSGTRVKLLSIGVGFVVGAVAIALNEELIPADYVPYVLLFFGALAFGLAASGYYSLAKH
jgi:hypothetical protein